MTEMVLVSCSKTKQDGVHRAVNLYEPSSVFTKRRDLAAQRGAHLGILSGKHGYLRPWDAVGDYEFHISERTPIWAAFVLRDLLPDLEYYDVEQVTILAGSKYVNPLVTPLEYRGYDVVDLHNGMRPGERRKALKVKLQPGRQTTLATDGGEGE